MFKKLKNNYEKIKASVLAFTLLLSLFSFFSISPVPTVQAADKYGGCLLSGLPATVTLNKQKLNLDEEFIAYFKVVVPDNLKTACSGVKPAFRLNMSAGSGVINAPARIEVTGLWNDKSDKFPFQGFQASVRTTMHAALAQNAPTVIAAFSDSKTPVTSLQYQIDSTSYVYWVDSDNSSPIKIVGNDINGESIYLYSVDSKFPSGHNETTPGLPKPEDVGGTGSGGAVDSTGVFNADEISLAIGADKDGYGLRSEYRIAVNETLNVRYYMEWAGASIQKAPARGATVIVPDGSKQQFGSVYAGIYYAGKDFNCPDARASTSNTCGLASGGGNYTAPVKGSLALPYAPISTVVNTSQSGSGGLIGQATFSVYPILDLLGSQASNDYPLKANAPTITVKIYDSVANRNASFTTDNIQQDSANPQEAGSPISLSATTGDKVPDQFRQQAAVTAEDLLHTSPNQCQTGTISCFLSSVIIFIIGFLRQVIYTIFYIVLLPFLQAMLSIRAYTDAFASIIYPGWIIIRNLGNVFLIISMLIIGLATLFRIDGYNYKELLVKIVMAALLVNFSLVISQSILGIAETAGNQFLPNRDNAIKRIAADLMVGNPDGSFPSSSPTTNSSQTQTVAQASSGLVLGVTTDSASQQNQNNANGLTPRVLAATTSASAPTSSTADPSALGGIIYSLFSLALAIGSFIAFAMITALLVVRIIALLLLMMLSPIGLGITTALPSTAHYRDEWWSNFLKYAFFAPIAEIMLAMLALIVLTLRTQVLGANIAALAPGVDFNTLLGGQGFVAFTFRTVSSVVEIGWLYAIFMAMQTIGIAGAGFFVDLGKKGLGAPFMAVAGAGKWLGKDVAGGWIQKQYNNRTAQLANGGAPSKALYALLHAPSTVKSFRKDAAEQLEQSKELTEASTLSIKRKIPGFRRPGEDPIALYNEHKGKELWEKLRGNASGSEQDEVQFTMGLYDKAIKGDKDAQLALPEQLRHMFKNHNMNEFVNEFGRSKFGLKGKELNYNKDNLGGLLDYMQQQGAMSEHINEDFQKRLGNLAYDSKDLTGSEMTWTDHHGHAHTIKRKLREDKKGFEVVGMDEYRALHSYARENTKTEEQYQAMLEDLQTGKGEAFEKMKAKFQQDNGREFVKDDYENADHDQQKILEKNINLSKKKSIEQLDQWWESQVSKLGDGKVVFASSGKYTFTHLTPGHEYIAGRDGISDRVKEFYLPLVIDQQTQLRDNLREAIVSEANQKGRYIENLEKEVAEAEYKNLRLAFMAIKKDPKKLDEEYSLKGDKVEDFEYQIKRLRESLTIPKTDTGVGSNINPSGSL